MGDLIRQWVWMDTMAFACHEILHDCKYEVVANERERLDMPWDELCEKSFRYALKNWDSCVRHRKSRCSGSHSGHNHYSLGYAFDTSTKGFTGRYKSLEVTITYDEARKFVENMLSPESLENRQMTMLDLLAASAAEKQ